MQNNFSCVLVLEDGQYYKGNVFGKHSNQGSLGEVVFNTSLSGYQEIFTDPSYKGQFVCFTYPSIGNYGINSEDNESDKPYLQGVIVRDYCETPSNFRLNKTLDSFLEEHSIPGISGIDTRALVRHIREKGTMQAGVFLLDNKQDEKIQIENFISQVRDSPSLEGQNLTGEFSGEVANRFIKKFIQEKKIETGNFKKVLLLDFGVKFAILRNFLKNNIFPVCVGGDTPYQNWNFSNGFEKIEQFDGFFLSNGPGDPAAIETGINNTKYLLGLQKPIFGICLGHQILSLAKGGKTYKLKFGHHGGNQPVKANAQSRIDITAQNHGFAVDEDSLLEQIPSLNKKEKSLLIHNLNDNTFAGYLVEDEKLMSVQYHPEACPGPHDVSWLFDYFYKMMVS